MASPCPCALWPLSALHPPLMGISPRASKSAALAMSNGRLSSMPYVTSETCTSTHGDWGAKTVSAGGLMHAALDAGPAARPREGL